MAIDWNELQTRYDLISEQLVSPTLDNKKRLELQRELSKIAQVLHQHRIILEFEARLAQNIVERKTIEDPELADLFDQEIEHLHHMLRNNQKELEDLLYPSDEHDDRSVYLEIRAGAGGQEAALFAHDLLKMYLNYALQKGWKTSIESISETDLKGIREVVVFIKGKGVYGHLKHESGVHRVQRVPETETQGRVHTSTATVAVLPEADEVDVTINPADLRIDVYRASGAGGQHVNTTDSAVRITHIPTGVVTTCQDERSQHKNRMKAMKMLQSRLLAAHVEKEKKEVSQKRKEQVGTGERAEKVRTYNFPQNRVTDHQVNLTLQKLDMVIAGDLDDIIQALRSQERDARRETIIL